MPDDAKPTDDPDLRVVVDDVELAADWTDDAPETRDAIRAVLPLADDATRWGDELYFETPVATDAENAAAAVPVGALAYWPTGRAVCLFWGPTPASEGDVPRAASPVNVFGRIRDTEPLAAVDGDARVRIEEW